MAPPVVQPGLVSLYAGEAVTLEADVEGDRLTNLRVVSSELHPDRTIHLELVQRPLPGSPSAMLLTVRSGFSRPLKYSLGMMLLNERSDQVYSTSSCPVFTGAFESWPHAIFQLVFTDFQLLDPSDKSQLVCR
jgi:hypothetical protein